MHVQVVPPLRTYDAHSGVVEDVAWHQHHPVIFASVGDDKKLMIWDVREKKPRNTTEAHTAEVNCVQARRRCPPRLTCCACDHTRL
jgi:WD40 repeat protein